MPTWEYEKVDPNDVPRRMDEIVVSNEVGKDGGQLVQITASNIAYLKREMPPEKPAKKPK